MANLSDSAVRYLWNQIKTLPPHQLKKTIDNLDEETINKLRRVSNPYKQPVYMAGANEQLAFSFINLKEKYYEKFAMTSVVAFIYRILSEYQPSGLGRPHGPGEDVANTDTNKELVSENDPEFASRVNKRVQKITKHRPLEIMQDRITALEKLINNPDTSSDEATRGRIDLHIELLKLNKYNTLLLSKKLEKRQQLLAAGNKDVSDIATNIQYYVDEHRSFTEKKAWLSDPKSKFEHISDKSLTVIDTIDRCDQVIKKCDDVIIFLGEKKTALILKAAQLQTRCDKTASDYEIAKRNLEKARESFRTITRNRLPAENINTPMYEPTDTEIDNVIQEVKAAMNIRMTREEYHEQTQDTISKFLDTLFVYNPDLHVMRGYSGKYKKFMKENPEKREQPEYAITPPRDTFTRWNRYVQNHYEELRQATDDIYGDVSDLEFVIAPLKSFTGSSPESATAAFDEFKKKHAEEFETEVYNASFGRWNFIASFQPNRDLRDVYTRNTEIMQEILKQNEKDSKMGDLIAKKRALRTRSKNKKSESFNNFTKINPPALRRDYGVQPITENDIPRDGEVAEESEMEVGVTVIKAKRDEKRLSRIRGIVKQYHFNVTGDESTPDSISVEDAAIFKNKMQHF